jgi:hypothetical protein
MMTNNDVCLFEFVGEVEKNQHTNITSNVFALCVTMTTSLSNVKSVRLHTVIDFASIDVEVM